VLMVKTRGCEIRSKMLEAPAQTLDTARGREQREVGAGDGAEMIAELAATASPVDRSLAIRSHRLWLQWVRRGKSPGQPYLMGWERKVSRAPRKSLTLVLDQESVAQLPFIVLSFHTKQC
jgi:hypothetical protein